MVVCNTARRLPSTRPQSESSLRTKCQKICCGLLWRTEEFVERVRMRCRFPEVIRVLLIPRLTPSLPTDVVLEQS